MPASSKSQQKFMGMVHALQKGELNPSDVSAKIRKVAGKIDHDDAEDFASTKHDGLPDEVEETKVRRLIRKMVREIMREGGPGSGPQGNGDDEDNPFDREPTDDEMADIEKQFEGGPGSGRPKAATPASDDDDPTPTKNPFSKESPAHKTWKKKVKEGKLNEFNKAHFLNLIKQELKSKEGQLAYANDKVRYSGTPKWERKEWLNVSKDLKKEIKILKIRVKQVSKMEEGNLTEKAKRDYKAEYKKFQSSTKAKKYRAELNKYNRQKGTYGNGDKKDASHKNGKIVGFEEQSKNRGRAEKSRLKKEGKLTEGKLQQAQREWKYLERTLTPYKKKFIKKHLNSMKSKWKYFTSQDYSDYIDGELDIKIPPQEFEGNKKAIAFGQLVTAYGGAIKEPNYYKFDEGKLSEGMSRSQIKKALKNTLVITPRDTLDYKGTSKNLYKAFKRKIPLRWFIELTDTYQGYRIKKSDIRKLLLTFEIRIDQELNEGKLTEDFQLGTDNDKLKTKTTSEKLGYTMVGEMPDPTFNIANVKERGDAEFPSGNLKEGKLNEAKETPKVGDQVDIVTSSYYTQKILKVSGGYVVVDNKSGRKAPAVILGKKKDKLGLYKSRFKIKINNLKKSRYQHQSKIGITSWVLKSTKRAIDGKDLEFDSRGRSQVFGYVNEGKINETTVRLSTMKDASFEPGQFVQLLGKKGKVKLDKKSVKFLAKWIRSNSGKHGMGWSFTEGKLNEGKTITLPNGVKATIDFKGIKFKASKGAPVFLDRAELLKFFRATTKYLRYS